MNGDLEKILSECSEFVSALKECPKGYFLYRGSHFQIPEHQLFTSRLENRIPVNTPQEIHDKVNEFFEVKFGWKIRNGVFCYGYTSLENFPRDLGYGPQFLCFPVGGFEFVYSPDHFDLCGHFYRNKPKTEDEIRSLKFGDKSLEGAINSRSAEEDLSNEISIKVSSYYLINTKHRDSLVEMIWD